MSIFENNVVTNDQSDRIDQVRAYFGMTLAALDEHVPDGKEKGIMVTKLEEACMWAVKGISREEEMVKEIEE